MYDACFDRPSILDYKFADMFWAVTNIYDAIFYNFTEVQDQSISRTPSTDYACTNFSISHIINISNFLEWSDDLTRWEDLWNKSLEKGIADVKTGAYLQDILKFMKTLGYIAWYAVVNWKDEICQSIFSKRLIYTGTNKCNWEETRRTGIFTPWESYWHCFCGIWFDKQGMICRNSYDDDWGNNWHFTILWKDLDKLFTTYSIIDMENQDAITKKKIEADNQSKKIANDYGIISDKRPQDNITREEIAIAFGRLISLLQSKGLI